MESFAGEGPRAFFPDALRELTKRLLLLISEELLNAELHREGRPLTFKKFMDYF